MRLRSTLTLALLLLAPAVLRAQPASVVGTLTGQPTGPRWTQEPELLPGAARRRELLLHFTQGERGVFAGVDGVAISWVAFRVHPERAAIVLVPGRTESWFKYPELIFDLNRRGYSVFVLDHRGQGFSGRMLGQSRPVGDPERQKQYVKRFDDYVRDLESFVHLVVRRTPHRRVFGLAHSMGGGILTRLLEQRPGLFDAAVLSSPMHGLNLSWWEKTAVQAMVLFGQGTRYARGEGPHDSNGWKFAGNGTTSSAVRYAFKAARYESHPEAWTGGPTWNWVRESLRGTRALREDAAKLTLPLLLLQAGDERVVNNAAQDEVARRAPNCRKLTIAGARHELLMESDPLRGQALDAAAAFFAAHE